MYPNQRIEKKWQKYWEKNKTFSATENPEKKKYYALDMFPYPSNDGLHVGHPEGYTATDIIARFMRMHGANVLHPMGWDAFGLPAENYAIKKGVHPAETTEKNIGTFRRQIKSLGFSYDWDREINTSSPDYYQWTQWLFLQLYKHNLAYRKKAPVNWCERCQTVLANEQVIHGACERCANPVIQKELTQWFLGVTRYAEELLSGLEILDWPESIKTAQRNWIGKSEGAIMGFEIKSSKFKEDLKIDVFTTRPDTLFGATYLVLAPEHPLIAKYLVHPSEADSTFPEITSARGGFNFSGNYEEVIAYIEKTRKKSELERLHLEKEKTGVQLKGIMAINPATGEEIPVWIADYVLATYGTGAIMAVPAHDERDFEFAKKFNLPIKIVVCPNYPEPTCPILDAAYTGSGHLVESGQFNGYANEDAKKAIADFVGGEYAINYKLRDWLISRQRYWGAPIPIIYCDTCGEQGVPEIDLPVLLPTDVDFNPTGESPLANSKSFHTTTCPVCGKNAKRESDTMDTFVCSSWYFLRYISPHHHNTPFENEALKYWLPVDLYVGGAEHAVLHLLYSRFITKALRDMGNVSFDEPFVRLRNQGMILGEDGEKMSKSRGNVINPDDVIKTYGADTMRLYEMFIGPFEDTKPWGTRGIIGLRRFLDRVWNHYAEGTDGMDGEDDLPLNRLVHATIKKVTEDIATFHFNTAISSLMVLLHEMQKILQTTKRVSQKTRETYIKLLSPFAPHIAEELWERMGHTESIAFKSWPLYDENIVKKTIATIIIQINGKTRDQFEWDISRNEEEMKEYTLSRERTKKWITDKKIIKIIGVKGKLLNIVTE